MLSCFYTTNFIVTGMIISVCASDYLKENSIIYGISDIASRKKELNQCFQELEQFKNCVLSKDNWALKMFDSSGNPNSGFTFGNNFWIGSHFQCMDIQNRKPLEMNHNKSPNRRLCENDFPPFDLAFAKVHLKHNSTLQIVTGMQLDKFIQLGLCIPKSCNLSCIQQLLITYLNKENNFAFKNLFNLDFNITNITILREDVIWIFRETKTILLLAISLPTVLLVMIATLLDQNKHETNSNSSTINISQENKTLINCFSLKRNITSLLNTDLCKNSIPALHGIRFFGMLWIISVHSIFFGIDYFSNIPQGFRLGEYFLYQVYSNSSYCVDTFFFISGFLLSYLFFKHHLNKLDCNHKKQANYNRKCLDFVMLYVNRFLRLTYPYLISMLLADVIFTYFRSTSSLHSSENPDFTCSKYWWRNLLYINNLYPRSEMCLSWSWYLSIDSQFFLISTFLLILSTVYFKVAATIILLLVFTVILTTTIVCYKIGYIPTMDDQLHELDTIYDLPWNRMGPYLIGIITGYILVIKLQCKLQISKLRLIFCWIIFPSINIWVIFAIYGREISVEFSAIYMGFSRTLWGVGIGWLVIACSTNNAGIINQILSYKAWIPLSKLTYSAYLLNPIIANSLYLLSDTPFHSTISQALFSMCGVTVLTFGSSFLFSSCFEMPFVRLTKILQEYLSNSKKKV